MTLPRPAVFAIPGEITRKTGGFIYERALLLALRDAGHDMHHLQLGASFPHPTHVEMAAAARALADLSADRPVIIDGLVLGSIDTDALAAMRAPIVAMTHHPLAAETGLASARAAELRRREAANLALAAHVVVPSPHTAEILQAEYGVARAKISVALPGVRRPRGPQAPVTPPLILAVGLLAARKGHDVLLDALATLGDLDWRAEIVGGAHDADVADVLRRHCTARGLDQRVRFAGELDAAALDLSFRSATIFALATRYEGYGMVFAEALAHGLPIVSCRTGAVPGTVPETAGLLVPPDDPDALAGALRRLLEDHALRAAMSAAARDAGARLPDWTDTARVVGGVLDSV